MRDSLPPNSGRHKDNWVGGTTDLSIIVVNWNSAAFLRKCLASVETATQGTALEVIVVDNASYDGCDEMVKREFPLVKFVQNPRNDGFACANNLGFSCSCGKNLLFLNPDTEVLGSALDAMQLFLETTPDAGIVGPKLLNTDGSIQTSCIQRFPRILNQILDIERLQVTFPKCPLWGIGPLFDPACQSASVEVVSGACLMIRRNVFEQVGHFTTNYFMYAEDVDLCWKVKQLGFKNYYLAEATVVHHGGQSTAAGPGRDFSSLVMVDSCQKFLKASRGRLYAHASRFAMLIVGLSRTLLLAALAVAPPDNGRRKIARTSLRKWLTITRWTVGLATPVVKHVEAGANNDGTVRN